MSQEELIWGAFSLMILGALISMCMKCQQIGSKQEKTNVDSQKTQCEDQQDFDELPHLSSMSKQPQMGGTYNMPRQSKSRDLSSLNDLETCSMSRHQNFLTEIQIEQNPTYVYKSQFPAISSDGWKFLEASIPTYLEDGSWCKQWEDDDYLGYQNVIETPKSSGHVLADVDIYENSLAIQLWKCAQISESSNDNYEEEPTYINTGPYNRYPA